ncbi:putative isomerase YbhE [Daldinia vernicosa]|uniref:putative isomerase YbhE n=1 Tax=Daldinia vernicosa TaxID=114800 RepID=UPI0020075880|nr:putative isomerase YbhE [Daldinia vernicosa]KAI0844933.1 putative isomerase YbhE [Daldinia vernicosa]
MKYNLLSATVSAAASIVVARNIYVASYAGPVYRLAFTSNVDGSHSLREVGSTLGCGRNPGWLELDPVTDTLFCANEAYTITDAGSVASFSKESLSILGNITTDYGPVQSAFYAPNRLGLAHYSGGAVSVVDTSDPSNLVELQSFHYFMDKPGPNSTLQDKPYPHGIVADPTGKFVVVLDRGADALRTYAVGWDGRLVELGAHYIEPGNGPRHGVFVKGSNSKTFFYVLGELTNSLHGFEVVYRKDGTLGFKQFYKDSAYQTGFGDAAGVAIPAEIAAVENENGRHIVLSTRDEGRSVYRGERSDTITGDPALVGLTASGGLWPRSFAISRDGTLLAAANQHSVPGRLVVFSRDPETGVIDDQWPLVMWTTDDTFPDGRGISHVIWDE